ncbi:sterol carrier family protein [Gardnerella vaginalis]|uniref:sterol carrier family protein n=1 Tax=Gardnerella vaginalis TaxID=2702 RepID=UPI0039EDE956
MWNDLALKAVNNEVNAMKINSNILNISRTDEALAVRYSLYVLENKVPGCCVEVRVAPWGAVKILEGPESDPHNLTPPDVIELEPSVWLRLVCGITKWDEEKEAGNISAMGERDNLSAILPLEL